MDHLDHLRIFLAIVDGGSLAAAARRLRRSPPAVTRILAELEAELGTPLIVRSTRRLALTDAGLRLAEHGRRLTADYDDAMRDVAGERAAPRGRLRLSAPSSFGRLHVLPVVQGFLAEYPEVRVHLSLDDQPIDLIEDGIDAALRIAHLADSALMLRRLGQVRRVVVASPGYLARHGTPALPADLAAHQPIVFVNSANGPDWPFAGGERVRVAGRLQVDRAEAAIAAARDGLGLARVLSYQVADDLAAGRLVRVLRGFELPPIPVQLLFPAARLMAPRLRAFLDFAVPRLAALQVLHEP